MRKFKFRAWNTEDKKMTYVDEKNLLIFYSEIEWSLGVPSYEWELESETDQNNGILMQYTGLKDKNGVEIYEGDIVKYVAGENYENTGEVIWVDETNSFNFKTYPFMCGFVIHNEKENKTDKFEWDETNYMEVIGNIYEDLELLERENK